MAAICACVGLPEAGRLSSKTPISADAPPSLEHVRRAFAIMPFPLIDVERLGAGGAPIRAERDLLDSLFGARQQIRAMRLQRFASRIDQNRIFEPDGAFFQLIDDFFEFGEGALEGKAGDVLIWLR